MKTILSRPVCDTLCVDHDNGTERVNSSGMAYDKMQEGRPIAIMIQGALLAALVKEISREYRVTPDDVSHGLGLIRADGGR